MPPRSLYVHVPFCVGGKCAYCDFASGAYEEDAASRYLEALWHEITLRAYAGRELDTLYIGGGTPTALSDRNLEALLQMIARNFMFSGDIEYTIEANPGSLTPSKLHIMREYGANRLSLGVQSLNDRELRTLGRRHSAREALDAIELAGGRFANLSLDLIYGIPGQGRGSWEATLNAAASSAITHVSAYELTPEPETPLDNALLSDELTLPDEEDSIWMAGAAIDILEGIGLMRYEISNYARPGCECRHNVNYWQRGEYMALGAGAHWFVSGRRGENVREAEEYISRLASHNTPTLSEDAVSEVEAMKEYIFLGLRQTRGIDLAPLWDIGDRCGLQACIDALLGNGMIEYDRGIVRPTHRGMQLNNRLILMLYEALGL